jgi:hypothetical protein
MIGYSCAGAYEQRDLRLDACRGLALWITFIAKAVVPER